MFPQTNPSLSPRIRPRYAAVAAALLASSFAVAGISDEVFVISASNANGSGSVTVRVADCTYDASKLKTTWTLAAPVEINDSGGGHVATVHSASITVRKFVRLNMAASVEAGDLDTQVSMQSPYLAFPTVAAADAQAQASVSAYVQDLNNNGFRLAAMSNAVFHADYNGVAPNGSHFAELLGVVEGGAGGTATASQNDPASGYRLVGADVNSLSCHVEYSLTIGDRATVSCAYRIIPEPSCSADADGDLTPDCLDDCPNDGGKIAPGSCGCGVSDVDTDEDGTPDCADTCPDGGTPGPCGCGEVVDSDGDGTPDCTDGCPNDPAKSAPGACGCGNAETDSDGDGVPDCVDEAPANPDEGNSEDSEDPVDGGGSDGSGGGSDGGSDGAEAPDGGSSDSSGGDDSVSSDGGEVSSDGSVVAGVQDSNESSGASGDGANADSNASSGDAASDASNDDSNGPRVVINAPLCGGAGLVAPLALTIAMLVGARRINTRRASR